MTFLLLCDPGWYVHKPDVENKWDGNTELSMYRRNNSYRTIYHNSFYMLHDLNVSFIDTHPSIVDPTVTNC